MRILSGEEEEEARRFLELAANVAARSSCLRSRCGSVIVKGYTIIGIGYNSLPGDKPLEKCLKDDLPEDFISDRTCCVHAEDRAIRYALIEYPDRIKGSRLYFIRIDDAGKPLRSGKPYCTWCSKTALDVGIAEFVLWHGEGVCSYLTKEYNDLSYKYRNSE